MKIPELSVSTSTLESSKFALIYGADSVYVNLYLLIANSNNRIVEDNLPKLINFAHSLSKKVYIDLSMYSTNADIRLLSDILKDISLDESDGMIISTPGMIKLLNAMYPSQQIIFSAGSYLNFLDVSFLAEQGIKKIIVSPHISFDELREIRAKTDIELDAMVHGAVCIANFRGCFLTNFLSYSGKFFTNCNLECRKKYYLVEEREGEQKEFYPTEERKESVHIFNSKDLCMLEYLPQFIEIGIDNIRINGIGKSTYYVAAVSRIYKNALDNFIKSNIYQVDLKWINEIEGLTNYGYTTFFYFGKHDLTSINYENRREKKERFELVGIVEYYDSVKKVAFVDLRSTIRQGEVIEFISPDFFDFKQKINLIKDGEGEIKFIPSVGRKIAIGVEYPLKPYDIVRRKIESRY